MDDFYRAFEERHRGSRELIKHRLEVYLPFVTPLLDYYPDARALDLGCGRGEWIELLVAKGFITKGVDLDEGMLSASLELGLDVEKRDALDALKSAADSSLVVVSAFHLVEHIQFDSLRELVAEAMRVLVPGGLLIMETPNPENIVVAGCNFYLDPTHQRPLPPSLLSFVTEHVGFFRVKVVRLQELSLLNFPIDLINVLEGVSPDYAVVAQKKASDDIFGCNSEAFQKEYGLKLEYLANRYDSHLLGLEKDLKNLKEKLRIILAIQNFLSKKVAFITQVPKHVVDLFLRSIKRLIFYAAKILFKLPLAKKPILRLNSTFPQLAQWILSAKNVYAKLEPAKVYPKTLYVDMTHVYKGDLKTGVQRVVRAIYENIKQNEIFDHYEICAVYLSDEGELWHYKYIQDHKEARSGVVVPKMGDLFLGLDLNSNVSASSDAGLFRDWKNRGVKIVFVVYDLLPIKHPEWWDPGVSYGHEKWLLSVCRDSDKIACISQSVMNDLIIWMSNKNSIKKRPKLFWFHLGADIENSQPSKGIPYGKDAVLSSSKKKLTFLMVGTLEPRKGHGQVISAFELLWQEGLECNLIIVGKSGWLVTNLVNNIQSHKNLNERLFWLSEVSDEYLKKIYENSNCLIAASEDEGFGLPLIEAAQHKLPIIARDINVFREVSGEYAYYFKSTSPEGLAHSIQSWLHLYNTDAHPKSDEMPWLTWKESAQQLMRRITFHN